jgi:hypothetical protein
MNGFRLSAEYDGYISGANGAWLGLGAEKHRENNAIA